MKQRILDLTVNTAPIPKSIDILLDLFGPVNIKKTRVFFQHLHQQPIKKIEQGVLLSSIQLPAQIVHALEAGHCVSAFFGKPKSQYTPPIGGRINDCRAVDQARKAELLNQGASQIIIGWWIPWHGKETARIRAACKSKQQRSMMVEFE